MLVDVFLNCEILIGELNLRISQFRILENFLTGGSNFSLMFGNFYCSSEEVYYTVLALLIAKIKSLDPLFGGSQ